jgi:hypothetical protein
MHDFAEWVMARPARGLLVAAALSFVALLVLPLASWLPASLMVLAVLAGQPRAAAFAAAGAALPIAWGLSPLVGFGMGLGVAALALVPPYLAGALLESRRSLSFTFQAVTLTVCAVLLGLHLALGDPLGVLMPLVERVRPALEETARALSNMGIERSAEEIGQATARVAWATMMWLVLLHTMLAQFGGLWLFGAMREPGLFGREFRSLRLGRVVAWAMVAALAVSVTVQLVSGKPWQPAQDVLFVLAGAFLIQALAVVHALREAQVLGAVTVLLAYLAVALLPMALVGVGFVDTWVGFRERFVRPTGSSQ